MKKINILAVILACIAVFVTPLAADTPNSLKQGVQDATKKFENLKCSIVVINSDKHELEKMGKVFAETYEFKKADIIFKSPDNLKINGELGVMKVEFITAGNTRYIRVPSVRFKKREDITEEQEKRMSALDVGVVSGDIWNIYNISLVRTEKYEDGALAYVLKLQTAKSKKYQLIWVDGKDYRLLQRDRMLEDDSVKVRTMYSNHTKVNGIWVPVKAEVYNGDGKLAATTETKNIAVNTDVKVKEFE